MDAKSRHYTHSINSGYELASNLYGAASNVYDNFPHVTHDLPRIPIPHTPKFPPIPSTNNVAHGDEKGKGFRLFALKLFMIGFTMKFSIGPVLCLGLILPNLSEYSTMTIEFWLSNGGFA